MITKEERAEVRFMLEAITQGKWEHHNWDVMEKPHVIAVEPLKGRTCNGSADLPLTQDDAFLIANAPTWLRQYEDTVTELEGQLEQVKESLVKIVDNMAETSEDAREMHMEAEWALSQLEKGDKEQ